MMTTLTSRPPLFWSRCFAGEPTRSRSGSVATTGGAQRGSLSFVGGPSRAVRVRVILACPLLAAAAARARDHTPTPCVRRLRGPTRLRPLCIRGCATPSCTAPPQFSEGTRLSLLTPCRLLTRTSLFLRAWSVWRSAHATVRGHFREFRGSEAGRLPRLTFAPTCMGRGLFVGAKRGRPGRGRAL